MTNIEAISILNGYNLRSNAGVKGLSALDIGIEAIKKQIPKKPILETIFPSGVKWWRCPICRHNNIERNNRFCHNCGQALDWGEGK